MVRSFAPPRQVDFREPLREYVRTNASGWVVHLEKELVTGYPALCSNALTRLAQKLNEVLSMLPAHTHARLQGLPIFLLLGEEAKAGGRDNGGEYFQCEAPEHYPLLDPRWGSSLVIYSARNYLFLDDGWSVRVLIHELSHAWQLEQWPERQPDIVAAWRQARAGWLYCGVEAVDGSRVENAYATVNQLEYFAELSCAYFWRGEYQPFDRESLRAHDPAGFEMIEKMWGIHEPPPSAEK
jgi:hypothetical protein